jgi:hypothetical protein
LNKEYRINTPYNKYSANELLSDEMYQKAKQDSDYKYLLKNYYFPSEPQWLIPNEKGKKAYEFIGLMNDKPIKILLDEGANSSVMTYNVAKEWNLLHKLPIKAELSAITPGGISIANYGKIPVTFQLENYLMTIKVAVIEGEQSYILMSEVDQARYDIYKDRENQIVLIKGKPVSYQDITPKQFTNLSHRLYHRNPDRTLNLNIKNNNIGKEDESHMSAQKHIKIIQPKVVNDKNALTSRAASYLARKTSDLVESEKTCDWRPTCEKLTQTEPNQPKTV